MCSFSIWHWLIVLLIVVMIFGTKKLRNIGQDLGGAVRGFKEGMKSAEEEPAAASPKAVSDQTTIEGGVREKSDASRTQA